MMVLRQCLRLSNISKKKKLSFSIIVIYYCIQILKKAGNLFFFPAVLEGTYSKLNENKPYILFSPLLFVFL